MLQRSCHEFLPKSFCLTVPKVFVGVSFCISENLCYRKALWIRGGRTEGVSNFPFELFYVIVPKNFVGESFSISRLSGIETFYAQEVLSGLSFEFFFVSQ